MKPLTIEDLRSLEVGDWVWIENEKYIRPNKFYASKSPIAGSNREMKNWLTLEAGNSIYCFRYEDYGKTWLVYKNKEQAECKGEIIDKERDTMRGIIASACNKEGIAKRCPERISEALIEAGYGDTKQAVREFAKRLKEIAIDLSRDVGIERSVLCTQTLIEQIDELLAEVTGK